MNVDRLASIVADALAARTPNSPPVLIHPVTGEVDAANRVSEVDGGTVASFAVAPATPIVRAWIAHSFIPRFHTGACQGCRDHTRETGNLANDGTGGFADFVRDGCRIRVASTCLGFTLSACDTVARTPVKL